MFSPAKKKTLLSFCHNFQASKQASKQSKQKNKNQKTREAIIDNIKMVYQDVVAINSHAVALMEQGLFRDAATLLEAGLRDVQTIINEQEDLISENEEYSHANSKDILVNAVTLSYDADSLSTPAIEGTVTCFSKALLIGSTYEAFHCTDRNLNRTAAVLLFNTAVANHMQGLAGDAYQRHLKIAAKFYTASLRVIQVLSEPTSSDILILLSSMSNLCCIHDIFLQTSDVRKCLDSIRNIIDAYQLERMCHHFESIHGVDISHFLLIVLLCRDGQPANHAPAA